LWESRVRQRVDRERDSLQLLRSKKAFIKVNCAALPKELIESELFGHTKGAFTGAHADKEGLVQHAAGGSLLLDEIAEMPVELQPKLLRVLQDRSYRKIGSEKNLCGRLSFDLFDESPAADAIREGLLRDDLFYRISTITFTCRRSGSAAKTSNC